MSEGVRTVIGKELQGRYRILTKLGRGGMGEVYLAEHVHLNRLEAIKVLKPAIADEFAGRFRREARAMNRLRHPNIVSVYDFGQLSDGRFYLSMEYAEGSNIKHLLDHLGSFEVDRAIAILIQMGDAIHHAHSQGVIHRDLKPANMILTKDKIDADILKILDFGVAKIISDDSADNLAKTGRVIMGTPAYMSPEILGGIGDRPSCDIYALGCIGFELLTGRPPFLGRPAEVCHNQIHTPAPRMGEIGERTFPKELEDVIAWCLKKDPDSRPETGNDVVQAFGGVQRLRRVKRRSAFPSTLRYPALHVPAPGYEDSSTEVTAYQSAADREDEDLSRFEFQLALKRLAESVADQGCNDAKLLLAMAEVNQADSDVARLGGEIHDLRRDRERVQQTFREREAALRFSLGELNFARDQGVHSGEDRAEMLEAIATLNRQLREVEREAAARHKDIDDREIELVARQSDVEHARDDAYHKLDQILLRVVPSYQSAESVCTLAGYVEAIRPAGEQATDRVGESR